MLYRKPGTGTGYCLVRSCVRAFFTALNTGACPRFFPTINGAADRAGAAPELQKSLIRDEDEWRWPLGGGVVVGLRSDVPAFACKDVSCLFKKRFAKIMRRKIKRDTVAVRSPDFFCCGNAHYARFAGLLRVAG